jgi:hypothetical protein
VQSLLLINNSFLLQRAKALSHAAVSGVETNEVAWIQNAFRRVYSRSPTDQELASGLAFLDAQAARIEPAAAGSAQAAFLPGKIPFRDGQAAEVRPGGPQRQFKAELGDSMPKGNFTIEAYIQPMSIYSNANVRTVAANGNPSRGPGWALGVTGQMSRRKPQTLVLHLFGRHADGHVGEEAVFSDHHISLHKPYYISAAVTMATTNHPGEVMFCLKDLSNDDEPLLAAKVAHHIVSGHLKGGTLSLGGREDSKDHQFDGLIDDVRLTAYSLDSGQLLYNNAASRNDTAGFWTFESHPDVLQDASGRGHPLQPTTVSGPSMVDLHRQAFTDFCHVLLNSNEFLYVE